MYGHQLYGKLITCGHFYWTDEELVTLDWDCNLICYSTYESTVIQIVGALNGQWFKSVIKFVIVDS